MCGGDGGCRLRESWHRGSAPLTRKVPRPRSPRRGRRHVKPSRGRCHLPNGPLDALGPTLIMNTRTLQRWKGELSQRDMDFLTNALHAANASPEALSTLNAIFDNDPGGDWLRHDLGTAKRSLTTIADVLLQSQQDYRSAGKWFLCFALLHYASKRDTLAVCPAALACCLQCIYGPGRTQRRYMAALRLSCSILNDHVQRTSENANWISFLVSFLAIHVTSEHLRGEWYFRELTELGRIVDGPRYAAFGEALEFMRLCPTSDMIRNGIS